MDTVIPGGGSRRGDQLLDSVEAAQQALQRAASAAFLKGDPMAEQMQAMAQSLGAQYDIFCAAKTMQAKLEQSIRAHTDTVTNGVFELVRNALNAMAAEIGPQLLKAALPTTQQALRSIKYRTIYWALLAMAALIVLSGIFSYVVGLNHGRYEGEAAAHAIQSAMAAGPDAATDWALLMADNNPVPAMSACRKTIQTDADGRRYCFLPVWLDPIAPPTQQ
jgi:hypothetical protein